MSVNIRRHPRGGWDVNINVLLATVLAAGCASTERAATHEFASIDALLTDCEVRRHRPCSTSRSRRGSKASRWTGWST